jgi:hypothetical protein
MEWRFNMSFDQEYISPELRKRLRELTKIDLDTSKQVYDHIAELRITAYKATPKYIEKLSIKEQAIDAEQKSLDVRVAKFNKTCEDFREERKRFELEQDNFKEREGELKDKEQIADAVELLFTVLARAISAENKDEGY